MRKLIIGMLCGLVSCGVFCSESSLKGSNWELRSLEGVDLASVENRDADSFTLSFAESGELSGKGMCNRIIGRYSIEDNGAVDIERVGSTMMACPNLEVEDAYLKALDGVVSYDIEGKKLTLKDDQKRVVMEFDLIEAED